MRELIVNADDFGRSVATNDGIARAHEHGIVTSASLMVCWPAAEAAARYAHEHPALSVGLHIDLSEWTYRDGQWVVVYENAPAAEQIPRQLERFRELLGRDPTHLDSHHHVHASETRMPIFWACDCAEATARNDSSTVRGMGAEPSTQDKDRAGVRTAGENLKPCPDPPPRIQTFFACGWRSTMRFPSGLFSY